MKQLLILIALSVCCAAAFGKSGASASAQDEKTALAYLEQGSAFYLKHDYKRAIPPYQKALDLEKEHPALDETLWKVLVDNLGMSYGISGNLKKAKEIFEYGISKDADYPMFYYNMACTYGEMKDMDKAIEYLKLAFARKENMIAGEEMPDPATDSSFERFMNNQKFLAALKEINK
jgi:tetratricopeptide (TPR) repeat protein